eukprot:TRINITY_DN89_c0_g1_i1.p1 TRINITY_DN89_c0_g1~~TRINITY_DN89_c0_g1_i1.p1  ORF type:complete len:125 (+),score=69.88 TRINITY_DN89_c0_g1_i1:143-517(+)
MHNKNGSSSNSNGTKKADKTWKFINNTVTDFSPLGKLIKKKSTKKPPTIVFRVEKPKHSSTAANSSTTVADASRSEWVNMYDSFLSGTQPSCDTYSPPPEQQQAHFDAPLDKLKLDFILSSSSS